MKPISVKDVKPFLDSTAIAYVRFSDNVNETVVPYNTKRADTKPIVSQFLDRLKTSLYPDGIYYMFLKDTLAGKERVVPVIKGAMPKDIPPRPVQDVHNVAGQKQTEPVILAEKPKVTVNEQTNEGMVSYKDFMDLKVELVALQFENQRLQELIEEYESMDEEEEQPNNFKDIFENMIIPLSDKYFEIKNKELELLSANPKQNPVAIKKPLNAALVKKHIQSNTVAPQKPVQASQPAGGAPFIPDGNPEQQAPQVTPEEQRVIDEIMSYDEAQVIEFYNGASEAGEGDAAYNLLIALRPEMSYLFVPTNSEQNEQ